MMLRRLLLHVRRLLLYVRLAQLAWVTLPHNHLTRNLARIPQNPVLVVQTRYEAPNIRCRCESSKTRYEYPSTK